MSTGAPADETRAAGRAIYSRTRWTLNAGGELVRSTGVSRDPEGREQAASAAVLARRARFLIALFMVILAGMVVRLAHWQLFGPGLTEASPAAAATEPARGRIVDRSGLLLATDTYVGDVYANPAKLRAVPGRDTLVISLTQTLQLPVGSVQAALGSDSKLTVLAKEVSAAQCRH